MPYQLSNYAENKIADFKRGQGITLPSNWYLALGSAASESSFTEVGYTSYARVAVARSLAKWAGTQSPGSTLASSGTSHATSNNDAIVWPTASGGSATATHVGLFDANSGGNCWVWVPIESISITSGSPNPLRIVAGGLQLVLGLSGGMSDYLANKLIDLLFRGQAFTWPTSLEFALMTTAPSNAGGGVEAAVSGYSRAPLAPSLANISGTQGPGTTSASSGTTGRISNNVAIAFPALGATLTIAAAAVYDAPSGGNLLFWGALAKSFQAGLTPSFAADSFGITLD